MRQRHTKPLTASPLAVKIDPRLHNCQGPVPGDSQRKIRTYLSKKLFVKTYGCQMNVYDSGRMTDVLASLDYRETPSAEDADMILLNTCHIREKAAEKVYSELGRLRALKEHRRESGADLVIAVAGCVAQAEGEEMARRAPVVDIVVGPQTYHRLPELLTRHTREGGTVIDTDFPADTRFSSLPPRRPGAGKVAFLSVQEGCDKFCTFCVVPYTRGAEFSRPAGDILDEARALLASGVAEIVLLGQNVNAWHGEGTNGKPWTLARLIGELASLDRLQRIRYTTSHPSDMSNDLISAHGEIDSLMPYLHLPVQSGSNRILRAMNRRHTTDDYLSVIAAVRQARPDIAISGDFIVGFPGESDADFAATLSLVGEVRYAAAFSFKYSPRPGTPAAAADGQVPDDVKTQRLAALQHLLKDQQLTFNRATVGHTVRVLLERKGRYARQLVGRSPWLQAVHVDADERQLGTIMDVTLTEARANSMAGVLKTP